ncbi:MAG: hypothetical protein RI988_1451 [Pseudomonadota bacterium]|jgi:2-polyprenyl-3-methyl-5-hydroxy-6-metoxy-1,4-benzoquinol methylase
MSQYYDGLNQKLLEAIPAHAQRVLELGCANGRLGQAFKRTHPATQWWGVDVSHDALGVAAQHLDRVFHLNLDQADLTLLEGGFDVVVIGDLLEHLQDPGRLLEALYDLTAPGARIVCCLPNMSHASVVQRLVAGDITYDDMGLLDRTHTHFYSPASAFKLFLDAGWLPHLQDSYRVEPAATAFTSHLVQAAQALGVPAATALRNLGLYQMVLSCEKWAMQGLGGPGAMAPFSVIVPVNRAWQHELNIAKSPGLREVDADVVVVQGAGSAAAAYEAGSARARHPWRLMVHQDVYLPRGSGLAIARQLAALQASADHRVPVGFAGLKSVSAADPFAVGYAGLVIDRTNRFDHGAADGAVSFDEFAVALHADCRARPDATLGWHLWGTDLCLQAMREAGRPVGRILSAPLFHNSTNDYNLPEAFYASAQTLLEKYPQLSRIPTLCGAVTRRTASEATALEPS